LWPSRPNGLMLIHMRRIALLVIALIAAAAIPHTARACEICLHGECLWVGPPDGGYCYQVFYPFQDCTFEPSYDCGGCSYPDCFSFASNKRAGQKRMAQVPFHQEWQIATVEVNGQIQHGVGTRIAEVAVSPAVH
jgi:hypothetical protein